MSGKYSPEQMAFFREHMPKHNWKETADAYEKRFGDRLSRSQIRHVRKYYGIHPEHRGAPKGTVPHQGAKFKVGDEKVDPKGYTWVKVCESSHDERHGTNKARACWRYKHHLVWEEAHDLPVPEGYWVVFANRDISDFRPENVVAVPRAVISVIHGLGLKWYDAESLQACIGLAKVRMALRTKRKEVKERCR